MAARQGELCRQPASIYLSMLARDGETIQFSIPAPRLDLPIVIWPKREKPHPQQLWTAKL